jgi:Na+/H+ antiporter NhaD/arsenite permease-like protein
VIPAGLIFLATYAVLAAGRVPFLRLDRTGAAIVGAVLMIACRLLTLDEAWRAVDQRTILLLFGMMVLVAGLRLGRFFTTASEFIASRVSSTSGLLVAVVFTSGILSALFVNDTICLVLTPLVIEVARRRGDRPLPYLLALATASNIGSVATITGNPQNMAIGSLSGMSYGRFTAALAPVALVGLAFDAVIICWLFRKSVGQHGRVAVGRTLRPVHRGLLMIATLVAGGVVVAFVAGVEPALVALVAAAVLLMAFRVRPRKLYRQIDWELLALFAGLFVVVAGAERAGLVAWMFAALRPFSLGSVVGMTVVSGVLSNIVSNVPAVMLFRTAVPQLAHPATSWLTLAMASTLAGNLTMVGSIANLIVVQGAKHQGVRVTFGEYLKVGAPVTLATIAFGVFWLSW